MSKPKSSKKRRATPKTPGEGVSEGDSETSQLSDSTAQNISQSANGVLSIIGEEIILQYDGDGDEQFKASIRKAAGLSPDAAVEGLKALSELARLRLKQRGFMATAPDYQKRLEAEVASLQHARAERETEKAEERRIRGEIEKLTFEIDMINRHSTKPDATSTKPAARRRPFGRELRAARMGKLCDPKQRSALIGEHLRENGVEGASEDHRASVSIYLDGERDWLESTAHLTSKELDTHRRDLKKQLQDLSGQLGPYPNLADKLAMERMFNYQLADEIAKSEPLNDEPADDCDRLRRLLRTFGESCTLTENKPWMADAHCLRRVCRRDSESFAVLLNRMLCSFVVDHTSVYFHQPAEFRPGDVVHIPDRFESAMAKLFWAITDQKKLKERQRMCERIATTPPKNVWTPKVSLPPPPRMEEEIESERLDTVEDRRRRGWSWLEVAEELVKLGLEAIGDLGGPETPSGLKEELRRDEVRRLAERLKVEIHRLPKGGD